MKLLLIIILLAAAFLCGYYFGQQPGNPDAASWVRQCRQMFSGTGDQVAKSPPEAVRPAGDCDPAFKTADR